MTFRGVMPAVPTAFSQGELDLASMRRLFHYLKDGGVHGIVLCGTTGEGPTVSNEEFAELFKTAREVFKDSVPIIGGVGTNSTKATIERAHMVADWGADGLLVVTPYYNKPPQEGLFNHFSQVAAATKLPNILYNVPSRTSCNLLPDTVKRLSKIDNIVAIKEASGSFKQAMQIVDGCDSDLALLTGEDDIFLPLMSIGCAGVISVIGNVAPHGMVKMYEAFTSNDLNTAKSEAYRLRELTLALFCETNPIPVKTAVRCLGLFTSAEARPPLCPMSAENKPKLHAILDALELRSVAKPFTGSV